MTITVFMHPKPMLRHNRPPEEAIANITTVLPGPVPRGHREPGVYIDLYVGRGRHQLVAIPEREIKELVVAVAPWSALAERAHKAEQRLAWLNAHRNNDHDSDANEHWVVAWIGQDEPGNTGASGRFCARATTFEGCIDKFLSGDISRID